MRAWGLYNTGVTSDGEHCSGLMGFMLALCVNSEQEHEWLVDSSFVGGVQVHRREEGIHT